MNGTGFTLPSPSRFIGAFGKKIVAADTDPDAVSITAHTGVSSSARRFSARSRLFSPSLSDQARRLSVFSGIYRFRNRRRLSAIRAASNPDIGGFRASGGFAPAEDRACCLFLTISVYDAPLSSKYAFYRQSAGETRSSSVTGAAVFRTVSAGRARVYVTYRRCRRVMADIPYTAEPGGARRIRSRVYIGCNTGYARGESGAETGRRAGFHLLSLPVSGKRVYLLNIPRYTAD